MCATPACFSTFFDLIWSLLFLKPCFFKLLLETLLCMIEIQYSSTALLLLVNPIHTESKQWHRMPQLYQLLSEKKAFCCRLSSTHYTAVQINNI